MDLPEYDNSISTSKYLKNIRTQIEEMNFDTNKIILTLFIEFFSHYNININALTEIKKIKKDKINDIEFNQSFIQKHYKRICKDLDLYRLFPKDKCDCGDHEYNMQTNIMYFMKEVIKGSNFQMIEHHDDSISFRYSNIL